MASELPLTHYVDLKSGATIAYCEVGDPKGKPVLFFHGWPSSRYQGALYDQEAKQLGYRLICPDRPGVGRSSLIPERELRDWPELMTEFADALGIGKFSVLGVSGGGPYVIACAALIPERLERAGVLCGAVVIGSNADMSEMLLSYRVLRQIRTYARPLLGLPILFGRLLTAHYSVARLLPRLAGLPRVDLEALTDPKIFGHELSCFRAASEFGAGGVVADGEVYLGDWGFSLEEIEFPIQFWHGDEDRNIPASMVEPMVERIPTAEVIWCQGEGHYSMALRNGFSYWADVTEA